jgi:hypothetical protein
MTWGQRQRHRRSSPPTSAFWFRVSHLGDTEREDEGEPLVAHMYSPIFDTFERDTRKLVGMFSTAMIFEQFFTGVLAPNSKGIICVVENACGDEFSFQINGEEAS